MTTIPNLIDRFESLNLTSEAASAISILNLPIELILEIFDYLEPVFAVCLGLTCKTLYALSLPIFKGIHVRTLQHFHFFHGRIRVPDASVLWGLLREWMNPKYVFDNRRLFGVFRLRRKVEERHRSKFFISYADS